MASPRPSIDVGGLVNDPAFQSLPPEHQQRALFQANPQPFFDATEKNYGLPSGSLWKIVQVENQGLNPAARSPTGVTGLMQVTLGTGAPYGLTAQNRTDPLLNLDIAGQVFRDKLQAAGGDLKRAVASYGDPKDLGYADRVLGQEVATPGLVPGTSVSTTTTAVPGVLQALGQSFSRQVNESQEALRRYTEQGVLPHSLGAVGDLAQATFPAVGGATPMALGLGAETAGRALGVSDPTARGLAVIGQLVPTALPHAMRLAAGGLRTLRGFAPGAEEAAKLGYASEFSPQARQAYAAWEKTGMPPRGTGGQFQRSLGTGGQDILDAARKTIGSNDLLGPLTDGLERVVGGLLGHGAGGGAGAILGTMLGHTLMRPAEMVAGKVLDLAVSNQPVAKLTAQLLKATPGTPEHTKLATLLASHVLGSTPPPEPTSPPLSP